MNINKKLSSVIKNKLNFINFLEVFKKVQKKLKKWSKRRGGEFSASQYRK
jgi:hypothetical protein